MLSSPYLVKEVTMSAKIPAEIQEFTKGKQGWVATAAKDGTPNVSIKGSLRVLDDEHLVFADIFSMKTRKNLPRKPAGRHHGVRRGRPPRVCVQGRGGADRKRAAL